jgi:hypothetical protein
MRPANLILLVEPEPSEVSLFQQALVEHGVQNPFHAVSSTDESKKYLRGTGMYENRELFPIPSLLFLNLDGRKSHAQDFLFWLRKVSPCKELVVVGLSHFDHKSHSQELFDLGLNGFFIKRQDTRKTFQVIEDFELLQEILIRNRQSEPGQSQQC